MKFSYLGAAMVASTNAQFSFIKEALFGRDFTDGLVELDLQIKPQAAGNKYIPENGIHLMELWLDEYPHYGLENDNEHHDYIEKNLYDFYDIQLYANIFVGSNFQQFEMIFDTGSSWVWVQSEDCKRCMKNDHKFTADNSESYMQLSDEPTELNYGKGSVIGYDSKDQVCLTKDSKLGDGCMTDYLFKNIVLQKDL